jgi:hypothetical protein
MNIEHKLVIDNDKQQVKFHLVNQVAKQVIPFSERNGYTAVKKCLKFVCLSVCLCKPNRIRYALNQRKLSNTS